MNSTKINQFFGKYAAFLLKWRWAALGLFAVNGTARFDWFDYREL